MQRQKLLIVFALLILTLSFITGGISPQITSAQTASEVPAELTLPSKDAFPRQEKPVTIKKGNESFDHYPLKKTKAPNGADALEGRLIVGFKKGVGKDARNGVHKNVANKQAGAGRVVYSFGSNDLVDVSGVSLETALNFYKADKAVEYVEPDYIMNAHWSPNDPEISKQYAIGRTVLSRAWDTSQGANVKIAILDTGIYESGSSNANGMPGHSDLNGKVVARRNFTGSVKGSDDWHGHGTHVAGIAAAHTNNGVGIAGAAPAAQLINAKVLDDNGAGTSSNIASGIMWAADNGAKVINMSLGGVGACSATYQNAIDYAIARNVIIVASAGNNGNQELTQPASCRNVISVANTDGNDQRAATSTYGSWVKIAAPGEVIYSTGYTGNYVYKSGTSMAAPLVAGIAALVFGQGYTRWQDVYNRVLTKTDVIANTGTLWRHGRINAVRAVAGLYVLTQRLYNPNNGAHFYTTGVPEVEVLFSTTNWQYTLPIFRAGREQVAGTSPVYRFRHRQYGNHFYTVSEAEKNNLIAYQSSIWQYETVAYYAFQASASGRIPVYRFFNPSGWRHYYTTNEAEKNGLLAHWSHVWVYEGVGFYAIPV
jgi:thermitase